MVIQTNFHAGTWQSISVSMSERGNSIHVSVSECGSRSQSHITITHQDHPFNHDFTVSIFKYLISTSLINIATCIHIQVSQRSNARIYHTIIES